ncbi:uncharacterized protein LOC127877843 isoform X4 [Dreissena polymorpha]|uniref:uncharacterized protein LOC127877843 isoform X4 n=1 Tax=Dreissena polymorpha TaxID=45954 RepID=UPI002263B39A|nr:uncharacterized protein LOC127877843 isoform X4 [Dreissena polymorpha]
MDTPDQVPGRKNISTRPVPTTDQVQGRKESKFKAQMDEKENDRQIKALKDRVEVLENQLKSRSSSDADCVKCATLEKALHQSTQYIDRLTAELETAKKQSAQEMDRLKVALETANENKDTETACLKKQVEELKTTTHQSSVPNDTKKLQEQLDQNKQQMDRQASELKIVKKDLEIKKEEIIGLQDEKKSIESELTTLKSLSESQNNSSKINTGLQDKIGSMKKQITQKDTEIGNKKSEIDALKVEINDLKKTIDTLRREKTMEKTAPPGRDDVGDIKQQLSKATHEIDELKSRLSKMVGENLTNNNLRPKNIRNSLVRCSVSYNSTVIHLSGQCNRPRCTHCNNISICSSFNISVTGLSYDLRYDVDCTSRNVIYLITCKNCNKQYVGQINQNVSRRMNSHRFDIKYCSINPISHVATHFGSTDNDCTLSDFSFVPIDVVQNNLDRLCKKTLDT